MVTCTYYVVAFVKRRILPLRCRGGLGHPLGWSLNESHQVWEDRLQLDWELHHGNVPATDCLLSYYIVCFCHPTPQGRTQGEGPGQWRGNYYEVGMQTSPGVKGNSYSKLKTPRIGLLFFGRNPSPRAKTNKNKNERH